MKKWKKKEKRIEFCQLKKVTAIPQQFKVYTRICYIYRQRKSIAIHQRVIK
ncbi:hypothetical protein Scep_014547 [Stephania cephalantha]|uniref:Uncharacterized protein n=1 Tax=Stephania cephalantha TaxID=152367 RepID=A0AAP0J416_9MAGN